LLAAGRAIAHVVGEAVHLDHPLGGSAVEVGTIGTGRMLLAEGDTLRRTFEALPEQDFWQAHLVAGFAGLIHFRLA
jgi:hypothetical protein